MENEGNKPIIICFLPSFSILHSPFSILLILAFLLIYIQPLPAASPKNNLKTILVGIDGADWEMITPLIKEGKLPHFEKLLERGASARINTDLNGSSAIYWTNIATGQLAEKHGITGFITQDTETGQTIPYTSNMRKTKAFWNIFSENNIPVGIVGWFVTWPVEKVNGFMVSSYYSNNQDQSTLKGTVYGNAPEMVYPAGLGKDIGKNIQQVEKDFNQQFKQIMKYPVPGKKPPDGKSAESVRYAKWAFAADEVFREIGIDLYKKSAPRVFAVYFCGIDVTGHRFTDKEPHEQDSIIKRFGNVHRNYYLYMDKVLGDFMRLADKNTVIMVVSDHGLMRGKHTQNGIFIASGPVIRQNIRLEQPVNLTDICPTLLYLYNQPVARDMDGQVVTGIFREEYLRENQISFVNSYGKRKIEKITPRKSIFDSVIKERLKSLGYM